MCRGAMEELTGIDVVEWMELLWGSCFQFLSIFFMGKVELLGLLFFPSAIIYQGAMEELTDADLGKTVGLLW